MKVACATLRQYNFLSAIKINSTLPKKPVELLRYLIRTYTNEGDLILDNCIGSGTTAVAAIKENRHFIGMELNKEYYDIACERISKLPHQYQISDNYGRKD